MYEIKNNKRTPTPISLPGRSFILSKMGDTAKILDREREHPVVKACLRNKWISETKLDEVEPEEDPNSESFKENRRIQAVKTARERAARRARGEQQ